MLVFLVVLALGARAFPLTASTGRLVQIGINRQLLTCFSNGTVGGSTDERADGTVWRRWAVNPREVLIRSAATCAFACLDDCGFLYTAAETPNKECAFVEELSENHYSYLYRMHDRSRIYLALGANGKSRRVVAPADEPLADHGNPTSVVYREWNSSRDDCATLNSKRLQAALAFKPRKVCKTRIRKPARTTPPRPTRNANVTLFGDAATEETVVHLQGNDDNMSGYYYKNIDQQIDFELLQRRPSVNATVRKYDEPARRPALLARRHKPFDRCNISLYI
ncbi:FGF [Lymantria xylina nucleopolyhedrovirus]|uniref:FGF n=1 Tax=Lymantria xylina multiple nucleopolyhedrovirus TaxID=2847840 RepID=D4N2I6_9ABAC|nr:FGF [Lymantria xylina nucleopolyhedrovirus]ADD73858.1 FGF [Lymantria xylina nucleopolyhedrovirus]